jgi:UPF0755 protein
VNRAGLAAILVVAVALFVVGIVFVAGGSDDSRPVQFTLQSGWSAGKVAEELEKSKVINSAQLFRAYMRIKGVGSDIKSGEYRLRRNMPFSELAKALREGPEEKFAKVTIPEGSTVDQTAARVQSSSHITGDAFKAAATGATKKPGILPNASQSLEGFLYPETYFVNVKESAADLITRMVDQFEKETADVDWDKSSQFRLSPYQALVIASMIEEEAKVDDERAKVSAVIHNRLKKGMKLEIDATVQYAVKKYSGEPLTQADIEVDSPYNTRKYSGLPPGPISSPRLKSINAALNPANTDDLFYVLTPDCKRHFFTSDFNEFLRAKREVPSC